MQKICPCLQKLRTFLEGGSSVFHEKPGKANGGSFSKIINTTRMKDLPYMRRFDIGMNMILLPRRLGRIQYSLHRVVVNIY
jgi:hypothetical protein